MFRSNCDGYGSVPRRPSEHGCSVGCFVSKNHPCASELVAPLMSIFPSNTRVLVWTFDCRRRIPRSQWKVEAEETELSRRGVSDQGFPTRPFAKWNAESRRRFRFPRESRCVLLAPLANSFSLRSCAQARDWRKVVPQADRSGPVAGERGEFSGGPAFVRMPHPDAFHENRTRPSVAALRAAVPLRLFLFVDALEISFPRRGTHADSTRDARCLRADVLVTVTKAVAVFQRLLAQRSSLGVASTSGNHSDPEALRR